jgi:hypothetical protein
MYPFIQRVRHDVQQAEAGKEETHAVLWYVLTSLNEARLTELLEGFHSEA